MANKKQLPSLADIQSENPLAFKQDEFKAFVNQIPPQNWVKKHPMGGNAYIPVDKVEWLLDAIIGQWNLEIKSITPMFQSVVAVIRLHYFNPATGEWAYHDGAGASPVQTDKGESAANLAAIKSNALQLCVPASVSYALKDAAEHIGAMFGRNVSRKDTIAFTGNFSEDPYSGHKATVIPEPQQQTAPAEVAAPAVVHQVPNTPVEVIVPPVIPVIVDVPVVVDAGIPKFEEDFLAPPTPGEQQATPPPPPDDLNAELDF